jgi:phage host-nuclease inhibitor protein Gam
MAKAERVKKQVLAVNIPTNSYEAGAALETLGAHQRERKVIEAHMNDEISAIKRKYEEQAQPHGEEIVRLLEGLHLYAEAHKHELLTGKSKTVQLTSGEIGWRTSTPKVAVKGVDFVIERIKAMGLSDKFLRIKEEINKENMLAEPEAAVQVPGVTINQTESFWAKPFETQLEEVAV